MFAVCPDAGTKASVVVAALPESIENFAYGVEVAPTDTRSVDVASVTSPALLVVQPPPLDAPPLASVPHVTVPEASVCKAWLPVQESTLPSLIPPLKVICVEVALPRNGYAKVS